MGFNPGSGGSSSSIAGSSDVALNSLANNHVLTYDSTSGKWANKFNAAHTHTIDQVSDATATGQALVAASSATAARTVIGAWQAVTGTKTKVVQDFTNVNAARATSRIDVVIEWRGGPNQPNNMLIGVDEWTLVG